MKNILLCTDGSDFSENIYRYGAWFAHKLTAKINVLSVTDLRQQQVIYTGNLSGSIGFGASEALLNELVELEHQKAKLNQQKTKLILQNASEFLKSQGITDLVLTHKKGCLVDLLQEFEDESDLIILGKRGESATFASGHLGSNIERIIRSSHKPCLITPQKFNPITKLLLAYDGSNTCLKIIQFLENSGLIKDLELDIITVGKNREDQTAISRLETAKKLVEKTSFSANFSLLEGEPEKAIAQYESENDISLLLMGAYGHNRIRQLVIGSTTAQLLRSSNIPILVFR
jgi:nucleotide-binding universal stress UspA family protein